jgi:hypothetical protein
LSALPDLASTLLGDGKAIIGGFLTGITNGFVAVVTFVAGIPGKLATALPSLVLTLTKDGSDLIHSLLTGIENVYTQKIVPFFTSLPKKLGAFGTAIGDAIGLGVKVGINVVIGAVNKMIDFVNNIKFTLPKVHIAGTGIDIGGNTISLGVNIPTIKPLAKGGTAFGGDTHLVGEEGPELFVPGQSGYVMTHADTKRLLAGLEGVQSPADINWGDGGGGGTDLAALVEAVKAMQPNNFTVPDPAWADIIAKRVVAEQSAAFGRIRL